MLDADRSGYSIFVESKLERLAGAKSILGSVSLGKSTGDSKKTLVSSAI